MEVISVTCALILLNERVLCAQRSDAMPLPGLWEFPGGKVEEGENPEACLKREILEELSISIRIIFPLKPNDHSYADRKVIHLMPFICKWESGEINLLEHQKVKWLSKEELRSLKLAPADIPIVEDLLANWNNIQKLLVE